MKIRFEANELIEHEGSEDLQPEEIAEWLACTTEEERTEWLRRMVVDLVQAGDHEMNAEVEDGWTAYVEDDG